MTLTGARQTDLAELRNHPEDKTNRKTNKQKKNASLQSNNNKKKLNISIILQQPHFQRTCGASWALM